MEYRPDFSGYCDESKTQVEECGCALAARLFDALCSKRLTLATAESCTGGLVAKLITDLPGASAVFGYGFITYSNAAKQKILHVPENLLQTYGAVSPQVAIAMAEGARNLASSDIALALTGIAGPDGATSQKPLGLVFIALVTPGKTFVARHTLQGPYPGRDCLRRRVAAAAFDMATRFLSGAVPVAEYFTPDAAGNPSRKG